MPDCETINDPVILTSPPLFEMLSAEPDQSPDAPDEGKFVNCEPSPWNEPEKLGADAVFANIISPVSNEPEITIKSAFPIRSWLFSSLFHAEAPKLPDPIIILF